VSDLTVVAAQVAMGVGLAACAGLRAFLPLFVVGVAGRLDVLPLSEPFAWLASAPALTVFGAAVLTELLADKVPVVDHLLDAAATVVKPVAGTVLAAAVMTELSPLEATVLGLVAGGGVSGVVHLGKAKLRLLSTVTTAGTANPILSFGEDALAFAGSLLALAVPLLVLGALAAAGAGAWWLLQRRAGGRTESSA
jgi:hypothetical protein